MLCAEFCVTYVNPDIKKKIELNMQDTSQCTVKITFKRIYSKKYFR